MRLHEGVTWVGYHGNCWSLLVMVKSFQQPIIVCSNQGSYIHSSSMNLALMAILTTREDAASKTWFSCGSNSFCFCCSLVGQWSRHVWWYQWHIHSHTNAGVHALQLCMWSWVSVPARFFITVLLIILIQYYLVMGIDPHQSCSWCSICF